jgi:uncharacterized protein
MKRTILLISLGCSLLFCSARLQSQSPDNSSPKQVSLINTDQFSIVSQSVKGESYTIQVGLPNGYSRSKKTYDVLYVLDGDKSFGMTKELVDWLTWDGEIRDIIVVGISYGKGADAWWNKRARDFTLYKDTVYYYYPNAGGADNFLLFLKDEVFPAVNSKYRTNPDSSALMGLSFGGLLTSYALFSQPGMFRKYIIISPSLFWNNNSILYTEAGYFRNHKDLNKTVYLAYGSLDDKDWTIDPTNEFIKAVKEHNYSDFRFVPEIFNGETHISVFPVALTHGLKLLFRRQ